MPARMKTSAEALPVRRTARVTSRTPTMEEKKQPDAAALSSESHCSRKLLCPPADNRIIPVTIETIPNTAPTRTEQRLQGS